MKDGRPDSAQLTEEPAEGGGTIEGGCVVVPNGKYELRYMYYETAMYFGSPRVVVHCAIDAADQYAGIEVCRFYNVKEVTQPTGKYGDYVALPCGDLVREYKKLVTDPWYNPGRDEAHRLGLASPAGRGAGFIFNQAFG